MLPPFQDWRLIKLRPPPPATFAFPSRYSADGDVINADGERDVTEMEALRFQEAELMKYKCKTQREQSGLGSPLVPSR